MTATAIRIVEAPTRLRPGTGYEVYLDGDALCYGQRCLRCVGVVGADGFASRADAAASALRHQGRRHPATPAPSTADDVVPRCMTCGGERHGELAIGVGECGPCRSTSEPLLRWVLRLWPWSR